MALRTSFERLEFLVRFFPEQQKVNFLSDTLIASLLNTEPHKVINEKIKTIQNETSNSQTIQLHFSA